VAEAVGERLAAIAAGRQVLVVTHLAVIAGRATHHLKLEKATAGGRTTVSVSEIRGAAREEELSRMLAGSAGGESARRTARRILRGSGAPRP
jgi:DNA repair protein RecN (Recombination protein N)